ncbi:ATP-dependent DNA helicase [Anaerococcus marasmi]|uniref:ATP-dependent DNA helicase n=1 Tax=Anaerococcus marasmi TaxID=2057797 RepID=UPI000CFA74D8|nr:ATP-dependent DNA helicase [Anaerococcus marasmi]
MLVKISVRNLIEFVMRSGDIDNTFRDNTRMIEGIRAHQKIQKSYGLNYNKEYSLKNLTSISGIDFQVEGRADGLIKDKNSYTIDEIKSTKRKLEEIDDKNKLHWAQAKCYAYFFSVDKDLDEINISLTYVSTENYKTKIFKKSFTREELEIFYIDLLKKYIDFSKIITKNLEDRNTSSKALNFPYGEYRKGQRKMAVVVYTAILKEKNLFVDAPTGIGKTISSIFPSIKSIGEDLSDKIFYLTAKTTTGKEAIKSLKLLEENGLKIKAVQITSKDRICLNDEVRCNPDDCPFAKGHFDRVNDALKDILTKETIMDYDIITSYAERYRVCPLEFEFDIASYSDFIICDYNYVFDPTVFLRRFFEEISSRYIFLIDEAHNLLDRARDMYSFSFRDSDFKELRTCFDINKHKKIIKVLDEVILNFDNNYEKYGKKLHYYTKNHIDSLDKILLELAKKMEKFLIEEKDDRNYDYVLEMYFNINSYLKISDYFMEGFYNVISFDEENEDKIFEIKCVDPSHILKKKYDYARSTVFFSATLSPMPFFMDMLGARDSLKLRLDMPFSTDNLLILQKSISTRYRDRLRNVSLISDLINEFINSKEGNYFIFFPSFSYLEAVAGDYTVRYKDDILIQDRAMSQLDRSKFIKKFTEESKEVAFVVLGGIFSEGVDLIGDRLIGSMIISVGMPGVSFDRNLIREHFDREGLSGFDYSYTFPGINKVFQAAGRVIRSEDDRGIIYLVDDRYTWNQYQMLFPKHWNRIKFLNQSEELKNITDKFWSENEKKSD